MQTVLGKRSKYQLDVIADLLPEVTVDTDTMSLGFPYSRVDSIAKLREGRKTVKGTGPSNAITAVIKALDANDSDIVVEIAGAEGEEAKPSKPAKAPRAKKAIKTTADGLCLCGCGEKVTREFLPGHDARYKGQLVRAALGLESTLSVSQDDALAILGDRNWLGFVEKSRKAMEAKAERKAKNPSSVKKGKAVHDGPTVKLSEMKEAAALLKKIGRYGDKAGERQIALSPEAIPQVIDGTHPDLTDADKVELGFAS